MNKIKELFHNININRKSYFDGMLKEFNITLIEVEILAFVHDFPQNNTFTDIFSSKDYTKSHISTAITRLIEKEYLIREKSTENKKIYYLKLLKKSNPIIEEYKKCVETFEQDALNDITPIELDACIQLLQKIENNLQPR